MITCGWPDLAPTLCIGLDIAWFGGSARDRDSQWDCIAAVRVEPGKDDWSLCLQRVQLTDRDPDARIILAELRRLLANCDEACRIVLAVDAPLQTSVVGLGPRPPVPTKGSVRRRAVESYLGRAISEQHTLRRDAQAWLPKIQPGAPLPPRIMHLLTELNALGIEPWSDQTSAESRLVIECFPAEAIWALRCAGNYPPDTAATDVKAYKNQRRVQLTAEQVRALVQTALTGAGDACGPPVRWSNLIEQCVEWMLADANWQVDGQYRGGKLLDDVVDSMFCLATALAFAHDAAHVWQDPVACNDGHIMGPGPWLPAH